MAFVLDPRAVLTNDAFRRVLYSGLDQQYVAVALKPGQALGPERHEQSQTILVVDGKGHGSVAGKQVILAPATLVLIEPNTRHDIVASRTSWLRLLVIHTPGRHRDEEVLMKPEDEDEPIMEVEEEEAYPVAEEADDEEQEGDAEDEEEVAAEQKEIAKEEEEAEEDEADEEEAAEEEEGEEPLSDEEELAEKERLARLARSRSQRVTTLPPGSRRRPTVEEEEAEEEEEDEEQ
jgi:quercetin dioxygenase-like cupin family protein